MRPNAIVLLFSLLFVFKLSVASAAEAILQFQADIVVNTDASLTVTETITVRAEGRQIRRGIYRDFPTRYQSVFGGRVRVPFEPFELLRDGKPEPWFTENLSNGVRVNFGDDSFLPVPLETTYTLRYHTARQLGFFADHDELYWNVTGNGWAFPIEHAVARVLLPQAVSEEDLRIDYYTGPWGSRGKAADANVQQPGVVEIATTAPLQAREGLTVSVGFPKGIVQAPDQMQRLSWFVRDNWLLLILFVGVLIVVAFYLYHWRNSGIDPHPGPIFPRYSPPPGFSAGALRYLYKGSYSDRCMAADMVQLGTQGSLKIEREKRILGNRWILHKKNPPAVDGGIAALRRLWGSLFHSMQRVELDQANSERLRIAKKNHERELRHVIKPRYLIDNAKLSIAGWIISAPVITLAFVMAMLFQSLAAVVIAFLVTSFVIGINFWFGVLLRRPTREGRALLDHIEGLRLYLRVASKDDIARLKLSDEEEPVLDAELFQALLPYALALDVEDAWTDRFIKAVGMAAAIKTMAAADWYQTPSEFSNLNGFAREIGGSLCSSISSSSAPPGSSSGAGGGGFSGGGGGGGGGGGR